MSTHKHFDKICVVAVVLALLITVLFMNGEAIGIKKASKVMQYENTLFDYTEVHTLDIIMNDWDGFIETCENEEYETCSVVIDGEAFKNVAIRAKGNTSLSMVRSSNSERYSFKLEFDHYDSTNTYYGLDKLSLNNLIQDNTYMKDYLTYRMMNEMGVAAPLCSYVNITVNGEPWGLYLAIEAIEDSFLQRNYGKDYGELYKPDSMSFGGGRGNGKEFDMDAFLESENSEGTDSSGSKDGSFDFSSMTPPEGFNRGDDSGSRGEMPSGMNPFSGGEMPDMGSMPDIGNMPVMGNISDMFGQGGMNFELDEEAIRKALEEQGVDTSVLDGFDFENATMDSIQEILEKLDGVDMEKLMESVMGESSFDFSSFGGGGFGGFGMGSSDVKLQYIDDNASSYQNIFNNAKTDVSTADENRLISALKNLSEKTELENTVDIDAVIKYFVVHNYVCNGDSYTGAMIHNYYLYEKDGQLSMLPWDYNLAFGSFQSSNATSTVNSPIDTPVSGGTSDRPMIDWIFSSEEYTEKYHEYFSEFIENIDITGIIEDAYSLIAPYVKEDVSSFCTYEEFEKGVDTLREFCKLRTESVKGQLSGEIPSTSSGQSADSSKLVDASKITISDMGSMGMGGGRMNFGPGGDRNEKPQEKPETETTENVEESTINEDETTEVATTEPTTAVTTTQAETTAPSGFPEGFTPPEGGQMPPNGEHPEGFTMPENGEFPEGFTMPEGMNPFGGDMPEGFNPFDGGEMPEDFTLPEGGGWPFG